MNQTFPYKINLQFRNIKKFKDYHGFGAWFPGEEELGPLPTPHPGQDGPVGARVGDSVCGCGAVGVVVVGEEDVPRLRFAGTPSSLGKDFPRRDMFLADEQRYGRGIWVRELGADDIDRLGVGKLGAASALERRGRAGALAREMRRGIDARAARTLDRRGELALERQGRIGARVARALERRRQLARKRRGRWSGAGSWRASGSGTSGGGAGAGDPRRTKNGLSGSVVAGRSLGNRAERGSC